MTDFDNAKAWQELKKALDYLVTCDPQDSNKHKLVKEWFDNTFSQKGRASRVSEAKQAYNRVPEQFKHEDDHVIFVVDDVSVADVLEKQIHKKHYNALKTCLIIQKQGKDYKPVVLLISGNSTVSKFYESQFHTLNIKKLNPIINQQINTEIEFDSAKSMINNFYEACKSSNLIVNENFACRFASALLAKRFLVLSGLAGSGKTKLAQAFASWICEFAEQHRLIAVGADWTSNENVLGYQDALQESIYRKPAGDALDLILRAEKDPERPYFLILDEMNLSHVERYFADILSAIESGQEIALHSAAKPLGAFENDPLPVPAKIRLPENLFIIGTVNIDETTYMFSPKVLDRANVIEFRATADEISAFLESPAKVNMDALADKGAGYGRAFVKAAKAEVSLAQLPSEIGDGAAAAAELKQRLTELFAELAPIGAEFGFRTAFEVSRFFYHHAVLTGDGWQFKDALDAQIVQKLMPKLHGSDRTLRKVLDKLLIFCNTHDLQLSKTKIGRMLERLTQDGFTSFAEA